MCSFAHRNLISTSLISSSSPVFRTGLVLKHQGLLRSSGCGDDMSCVTVCIANAGFSLVFLPSCLICT